MAELIPGLLRMALERALRSPTRSLILAEMLVSEEICTTALAERLGLDLNAAAYHVRSLARAGLIELTRQVPYRGGVSQKFYRVAPSLAQALQASPEAVAAVSSRSTAEERCGMYLAYLLLAATLLARAPAHYSNFSPEHLDSLFGDPRFGSVLLGALPRPALTELAQLVRDYLKRQWPDAVPPGPQRAQRDFVVFTALPDFLVPERQEG